MMGKKSMKVTNGCPWGKSAESRHLTLEVSMKVIH
jgi:hypothetical protein